MQFDAEMGLIYSIRNALTCENVQAFYPVVRKANETGNLFGNRNRNFHETANFLGNRKGSFFGAGLRRRGEACLWLG